jgi:hypothetical protein
MQACRLEIIRAFHPMRVVQCFDGLQRNQKHVLDQQVREVLADQHIIAARNSCANAFS